MTDQNDSAPAEGTPDSEGSETTQTQKGSPEQDPIALARKRQAGAEAARQLLADQLKEATARLAEYESKGRTASEKEAADIATLTERLTAAEKRAAQAEAKAEERILNFRFPTARAKFPEIADEVRLAELEALYADEPEREIPPPQNPNASNRAASGDATAKPKEKSSQDMLAELKAGGKPEWL